MMSVVTLLILSIAVWPPAESSSVTRGFPSLDELIRNGSLIERYSTHDGELRSVPGVRGNCSGTNGRISKITFVALPGVGIENTLLILNDASNVHKIDVELSSASQTIGKLGYELTIPTYINIYLSEIDMILIQQPPLEGGGLRLLHQVGSVARNICWSISDGPTNCQLDYDYPLLAIETEPLECIEGVVSASELRRLWENRDLPVLYSNPEREISLNCESVSIVRILVGAYNSTTGDGVPQIVIDTNGSKEVCNVSTEPVTEEVNVYECVLRSPVSVDGNVSLTVSQRLADFQIGFLNDDQTDIPLISVDFSGDCNLTSQLLSEADLSKKTALYIPNIIEREDDDIEFNHLTITQDSMLTNWTFVARDIGEGEEYPTLVIPLLEEKTQKFIENVDCSKTRYPNVYKCSVSPEPVEAGIFIGLVLPPRSNARLLLSFILNGGPPGESNSGNELVEGLPLITLGLVPLQSSTPTSPSVQSRTTPIIFSRTSSFTIINHAQPTTTPSNTHSTVPTERSDGNVFIIGVVSSLCLVVLTASVLSVLLVLWVRRSRRRRSKITDDVAYKMHDREVKTNGTEAYRKVGDGVVIINPASFTTSEPGKGEIATSPNEAYVSTDISTTDNPASVTSSSKSGKYKISTSPNEAYVSTGISTSDNPAYVATSESKGRISTSPNAAYISTDISTSDNPAYVTASDSGKGGISTTPNEAYTSTDISTSDNPAYVPAESSRTNTLVYDYTRV